jgi:arylformamidase
MQVYDLSVALRAGMVVWPGDPEPSQQPFLATASGDPCNIARITFGSHNGTHVDAPYHYLSNGKTVEQVPLDRLVGPARVVEIATEGDIGAATLERAAASGILPPGTERVLFKTRNSARRLLESPRFHTDFLAIAPDGAEWLVAHGFKTVGVDYLSVEAFASEDAATHRTLLAADVLIIEGVALSQVPPGDYMLVCGVLKLQQGDGSPARVFLLPPYPR